MKRSARFTPAMMLLVGLGATLPVAGDPGRAPPPADRAGAPAMVATAAEQGASPAARYFTDTELVDQAGRRHPLYSGLLKDQVVIINTFYTSCTEVCPVTMGVVKRIRSHLQDHLDHGVRILSFTVDPETDTPARLQEYAEQLGVDDGWYLLTGDPGDVNMVLKRLGQYTAQPGGHTNILIIGNDRTGLWKKAFTLSPFEELKTIVDSVVDDPGVSGS